MTPGDGHGDIELLRAEIERTRAELGQTVQALAAKADVKARMKESADRTTQRVRDQASHTKDVVLDTVHEAGEKARRNVVPWSAVAVGVAAIAVVLMVMRGRRR
ncbi:DUF3618 domain-containing protein [Micromonospora sp. NPDC049679]|uniref:DUF3618 domain-containing protein n=1 Tax=Micromonospora sp. NPDC049679 TaxID=3155920 RepID=UPI00340B4AED